MDPQGSMYKGGPLGGLNSLENAHSLALLVLVVFVTSAAQHLFSRVPSFGNPDAPTGIVAVAAGAVVALSVYLPIKLLYASHTGLSNNQVISMSVLLGIIVAYFMVFEVRPGVPSVSVVALTVFMFYHHIDSLQDAR